MTRSVRAIGLPAPQGSKVWRPNGAMSESSPGLGPWRSAVTYAAMQEQFGDPLLGPVETLIQFLMPRPKSAPKSRLWPDKAPDLDKLLRSTFDALTDARVWGDDAQVCRVTAEKRFATEQTGAYIYVRPIEGDQ